MSKELMERLYRTTLENNPMRGQEQYLETRFGLDSYEEIPLSEFSEGFAVVELDSGKYVLRDYAGRTLQREFDVLQPMKNGSASGYCNNQMSPIMLFNPEGDEILMVYGGLTLGRFQNGLDFKSEIAKTFEDPQYIIDNVQIALTSPHHFRVFNNVIYHHFVEKIDAFYRELFATTEDPNEIMQSVRTTQREYHAQILMEYMQMVERFAEAVTRQINSSDDNEIR